MFCTIYYVNKTYFIFILFKYYIRNIGVVWLVTYWRTKRGGKDGGSNSVDTLFELPPALYLSGLHLTLWKFSKQIVLKSL